MLIPDDIVQHMLVELYVSDQVTVPATNHPMRDLWHVVNTCHFDLRMPLYHKRLGKKPAKPAAHQNAVRRALAVLTAFAGAARINQAIVSSSAGWIRSISLQPRPHGMNWTADHAIDPPQVIEKHHTDGNEAVTIEDILHLAGKVACAVTGQNAGEMPDATATIVFLHVNAGLHARVTIREKETGAIHRAELRP